MKKLVTHITSDKKYYYLTKEVEIFYIPLIGFPRVKKEREILYKDKCIEKVKEFETEAHKRFNFIETTKETIIN